MSSSEQGVQSSANRYQLVPRTLVFLTHAGEVLLLKGAPDKKLWAGKFNAVGGHVERNEDVRAAARREVHEETGLKVDGLRLCGVVNVDTGEGSGVALFVFRGEARSRDIGASSEGELIWVTLEKALTLDLVEDMPELLPRVMNATPESEPFFARYHYDELDRLVMDFGEER